MTYTTREAWLVAMLDALRPHFENNGAVIPQNVRISCGWPSNRALSGNSGSRTIGQCWAATSSKDGTHEIFISPYLDDAMKIAGVIAHEAVHAAVGVEAGHKGPFKRLAKAIGLTGKMTATSEGPIFVAAVQPLLAGLGAYPHASLDGSNRKKQTTRLLKAECAGEDGCGYTVRVTKRWVDDVGAPWCPIHGEMTVTMPEEKEDE
jgi:hypothetical protein